MDDRWSYPIPMTMQRHSGSAPKPRKVTSPPVAPARESGLDLEAGLSTSLQPSKEPGL